MKTFNSLTQPITQLRRTSQHLRSFLGFNSSSAAKSSVSQSQQENLKGQPLQLTESPSHCEGTSTSLTSGKNWGKSQHQLQQKITLPVMCLDFVLQYYFVFKSKYVRIPYVNLYDNATLSLILSDACAILIWGDDKFYPLLLAIIDYPRKDPSIE